MRTTSDILGDFLTSMDTTVLVESISKVGTNWRCVVGKNHWGKTTLTARPGVIVTDANGDEREIMDFEHDEWFEVAVITVASVDEAEPDTGLWEFPKLSYMPGTPKSVNNEISASQRSSDARIEMPLVWLKEVMQERINYDKTKDIILTPIMSIFFLDSTNIQQWINVDHMENAVRPMRNYADRVVKAMIRSGSFSNKTIGEPIIINRIRFGESFLVQGKGGISSQNISSIFNESVSGVELRIEIPIRRECNDG